MPRAKHYRNGTVTIRPKIIRTIDPWYIRPRFVIYNAYSVFNKDIGTVHKVS